METATPSNGVLRFSIPPQVEARVSLQSPAKQRTPNGHRSDEIMIFDLAQASLIQKTVFHFSMLERYRAVEDQSIEAFSNATKNGDMTGTSY